MLSIEFRPKMVSRCLPNVKRSKILFKVDERDWGWLSQVRVSSVRMALRIEGRSFATKGRQMLPNL